MSKTFTLGKNERLKSRKLIDELFNNGKNFSLFPFRVFVVFGEGKNEFPVQFGCGVSTKNFKKAVDRNKVKRLTREAYRLQKNELVNFFTAQQKSCNVFFIYTAREIADYNTIADKVGKILIKVQALYENNPPSA